MIFSTPDFSAGSPFAFLGSQLLIYTAPSSGKRFEIGLRRRENLPPRGKLLRED
jgi:hypothetical protein